MCGIPGALFDVQSIKKGLTTLEGSFWNSSLTRRPEGSACETTASKSCSNTSFKLLVEV